MPVAGPNFDAAWYLRTYPDVAASGANPLLHYIEYGRAEGRNPKPTAEAEQVDPYSQWVREYDTLDDTDRAAIRAQIAALARRPVISIVVPVYNTEETYLREMIESVLQQLYPHWELCLADDASTEPHVERVLQEFAMRDARIKIIRRHTNGHICAATNSALDLATGEFVALLDHDDLLSERALYEVALELDAHPDADVVYSDSDHIDDSGRRWEPYFKTDWNPDLMLGHNMVSHLGVYRRALLERIGRLRVGFEGSQDYDLMLRAAEATTPTASGMSLQSCTTGDVTRRLAFLLRLVARTLCRRGAARDSQPPGTDGDTRARRSCTEDAFLYPRRVSRSERAASRIRDRADTG